MERAHDGASLSFQTRLAPADDPLVGFEFQEYPARMHQVRGHLGNFHASLFVSRPVVILPGRALQWADMTTSEPSC
jgi:hypothetical protein